MVDAPVLHLFLRVGVSALLGAGAWYDWRARRVPNTLVLVLFLGGLLNLVLRTAVLPNASWSVLSSTLLGALLSTGLGFLCWLPWWWIGMLGAGDVKFFAASAAWIGAALTWRATLLAALLGGVLSAAMVWHRAAHRPVAVLALPAAPDLRSSETVVAAGSVPYAIPMAMALALAVWLPQFLYLL